MFENKGLHVPRCQKGRLFINDLGSTVLGNRHLTHLGGRHGKRHKLVILHPAVERLKVRTARNIECRQLITPEINRRNVFARKHQRLRPVIGIGIRAALGGIVIEFSVAPSRRRSEIDSGYIRADMQCFERIGHTFGEVGNLRRTDIQRTQAPRTYNSASSGS